MNGVPAPGDAALSGNKKSSGRLSFFSYLYMCKHNIENEYINELNKYAKEKNKGTTQEVISSYLDENHPENSKMVICDVLSFIAAEEKYLKFVLSCTCFFIGIVVLLAACYILP